MMLCGDDSTPQNDYLPGCAEWSKAMAERGVLLAGMGLRPPKEASTVRVRGGEVLHTDGPFAETKEQMGGVNILECANREEALRMAATHPWAAIGTIEIRQVIA
jgi:hypothetical protein